MIDGLFLVGGAFIAVMVGIVIGVVIAHSPIHDDWN